MRPVQRSLIVALLLLMPLRAHAADPVGAAALHEKAQAAMQGQHYQEAAELFHAAFQLDPAPELLWNEARARHLGGDLERARELYKQFIERDDAPASLRGRANDSIVEITLALAQRQAPPPAVVAPPDDTFGTVMVVVGGALVAGGVVAHVVAFDAADDMSTYAHAVAGLDEGVRKQRYDDAQSKKDTALALAWVGYGVGAAALVTGIVSLVLTDDPEPSASLTPLVLPGGGGLGASLRF